MTPNSKIRELIKDMGIIPESEHYEVAERVMWECISICESGVGNKDYNTGRMHCAADIKQHFGVEE